MEVQPAARRRSGPRGHAGGRQGERKPVGRGSQPVGPMEPSLRAGRERRALRGIAVQPGPGKESGAVLRGGLRAKHRRVLCAVSGSTSREGEKKWGKKRKKKGKKKEKSRVCCPSRCSGVKLARCMVVNVCDTREPPGGPGTLLPTWDLHAQLLMPCFAACSPLSELLPKQTTRLWTAGGLWSGFALNQP